MALEMPGKRKRGRPKRRYLDVVEEDMKEVGTREGEVFGEGGRAGGRNEGRSCVSPKCFENPLWRPLTEKRKEEQAVIVSVFC